MITHPDKILFPEDGITKGQLAEYYETIAAVMLPHLRGRPITMERYNAGIDKPGFIQKDVSKGFPEWLERVEVPKKGGTVHHPLVSDTRYLPSSYWLLRSSLACAPRRSGRPTGSCSPRSGSWGLACCQESASRPPW